MPPAVLSVSRLVDLMRDLLEENFVEVLVEGEISNLAQPGSGQHGVHSRRWYRCGWCWRGG